MYVRSQAPLPSRAYHGYREAKRLKGEWFLADLAEIGIVRGMGT